MATKKKSDNNLDSLAEKLLETIGIKGQITVTEEEDKSLRVNIDAGEESGLLIGNRGRTLQSFQHILAMMYNKGKKEWTRVYVDVAEWREKEEERLISLAKQTAERARVSGEAQNLYNLNPQQRRIIHLALSEEGDITTESQGEGKDRYLVISAKS